MARERIVSIRMTEDEYRSLHTLANLRGIRVSELVRQIISTPMAANFDAKYQTGTVTTTVGDVRYFTWNGGS